MSIRSKAERALKTALAKAEERSETAAIRKHSGEPIDVEAAVQELLDERCVPREELDRAATI